ncbi:MAG TPA: rRNA maturation RNase YbeY [Flavobacterium sp.]|nr:rRNA maturation RNase YbeY [Flavobacterium sp.]
MIRFNYETDFKLSDEKRYRSWILRVIASEGKTAGDINFIFCDDAYLHRINVEYLAHDDLTDIISFDYTVGNKLQGDVFISVERVADNADDFDAPFTDELHRVMAHGILHYAGYKDKTDADSQLMRQKEEEKMKMFHVEQ